LGAYQTSNFAYNGAGAFAYQGSADAVAAVVSGGGDNKKYRSRRKVFYLPNGTKVLATEEEFERFLNPMPYSPPSEARVPDHVKEIIISAPYVETEIPRLKREIRELEDEEDIAVAKWMLMH